LLHAEFDSLHGIGKPNGVVPRFPCFDESQQDFKAITLRCSRFRRIVEKA
jgi:hypothetical protein